MVNKLLKHEFIYYLRSFGIFLPIVLVIGAVTRVFRFFDNGNVLNEIALASSVLMLVVACAALIILSTVVAVVRFYKNMYSSEGYLTFTLPVTNAQHILVKLFVAMVCQAVCVLTVVAAVSIAISGELFADVFNLLGAWIDELFVIYGTANAIGYTAEVIVLCMLSGVMAMLLYYACITVGQTAKKNRILMSFGAYFIYYVATQTVATVFSMVIMVLGMAGALDGITVWIESNMTLAIHMYLCIAIVIYAVMSAAFYLITHRIMTKKLNLE